MVRAESAHTGLLANEDSCEEDEQCTVPAAAADPLDEPSGESLYYVMGITSVVAIGGLLFGYDVGIISGALLLLTREFQLTCILQEAIVVAVLVGSILGCFAGGPLIDRFGRKYVVFMTAVVFLIGGLVLALSQSVELLFVGRIIVGFAVSISAMAECIYIAEIAPKKWRGALVSANELFITAGFLLAYLVGFLFVTVDDGWRYMFGLSSVFAFIQGVCILFLPQSPRFLLACSNRDKATEVLKRLRGSSFDESEVEAIAAAVHDEKNMGFRDLFSKRDNMSCRLAIAVGLVSCQQLTGQPSVLYYSPTILQSVGFHSDSAATLASVCLGIAKFVSCAVALLLVDRAGRRKLLLCGSLVMGCSLIVLGATSMYADKQALCNTTGTVVDSPRATLFNSSNQTTTSFNLLTTTSHLLIRMVSTAGNESGLPRKFNETATSFEDSETKLDGAYKWVALASLVAYVSAYSMGFGPVTWIVLTELFPSSVKGRAFSVATLCNWVINLVTSLTILDFMEFVSIGGSFLVYGGLCMLAAGFIFAFVPETKNQSLEMVAHTFSQNQATRTRCLKLPCLSEDTFQESVSGASPLLPASSKPQEQESLL